MFGLLTIDEGPLLSMTAGRATSAGLAVLTSWNTEFARSPRMCGEIVMQPIFKLCIVQAQPKRVWIILWTIEITTFNFTADFGFPYYGVQGCANLFLAPVFLAAAPSYVFFYTCLASPETACKVNLFMATLWPWAGSLAYHCHKIFDLLYHPHNHQ